MRNVIICSIKNLISEIKAMPLFMKLVEHPIFIVLIFASILRFWGIWHGSPFSHYPDERHFVNRAISFGSGDLNPHWFHKPAFLMYLLFFEYGLFFVVGKFMGMFSNVEGFAVYFFQNSWPFIMIGRITVSLFGIATIYVVYKIGKKFWSKTAGLCCAVLLALSYGHVFCGQNVKADVPSTLFTVLSIYFLLRVVDNNSFSNKDYILAGLFAGLGAATKYYSIVLLPCILIVTVYEVVSKKNILIFRKYLYSLLAFWGIYFVVSPYNFLDPLGRKGTFAEIINLFNKLSPFKLGNFSRLEGSENFVLSGNNQGHYILNSFINYIKVIFASEGVGLIIGTIFISSICYVIFKPTLKKIVLIVFPILFSTISIVMSPSYTEPRHQLIIYPFLSIIAGIFIYEISKKFSNKYKAYIILSFLLIFPFISIIENNVRICKTDTRTLLIDWIESNIPAGTKILIDDSISGIKSSRKNLVEFYEKSKMLQPGQFTTHLEKYYFYQIQALTGTTYDIKEIRHTWWRNKEIRNGETLATTEFDKDVANPIKTVGVEDYDFYLKNGFEYVVIDNMSYGSYIQPNSLKGKRFPSYRKLYENIINRGQLIKEFNPKELRLQGSTVKIFKIN